MGGCYQQGESILPEEIHFTHALMNIPKPNCVCNTGVRSAPGDGNVFRGVSYHTLLHGHSTSHCLTGIQQLSICLLKVSC